MPLTLAVPMADAPRVRPAVAAFVRDHALGLILALGLAVRLALLVVPRSYFPDEIFQYLEPAHRLVFGYGVVPWEYRTGIRSWLVPLALAGPMAAGAWIAPAGGAYLMLPKIMVVLASLGTIGAAAAIGGRLSRRHGLFAAFAMAIWSETALFGTQALTEALAIPAILGGAVLLERRDADMRALVAAGALLALGTVVRFQYGPAVAVLAAIACGRDRRRWIECAIGAAAVLAASAALDAAMGQRPFGWIVENFHQNIGLARSHIATDGPLFYGAALGIAFGVALAPVTVLALRVAPRFPALVACALTNIAVHTLIAHKEYRYILLSSAILVLLAAIATVDAIDAMPQPGARARRLRIAIAGWLAYSGLALIGWPAIAWTRVTPQLEAFAALRETPRLCGVAVVGHYWADTGGYAYLHRPVPLFVPGPGDASPRAWLRTTAAGFDTIVAPAEAAPAIPAGYRRERCFGGGRSCLFRRAGGCDPYAAAAYEINTMLMRTDH